MDDDRRLREIFDEAIELTGPERDAFLDRACEGKEQMRSRLARLLASSEEEDAFLAAPTIGPSDDDGRPGGERPGALIDRYKLLQLIGEGGFGTVWMAEQQHPVVRRVALKVIKLGMDTRQVIVRFEAERQALAMMDHPHIARVLDAGATDTGRPYFVMELVTGDPITTYSDAHGLSIAQRLELFVQVCQAVQHAHTKGIIHRDLKPTNVLVSTQDGRPHARVIDFGIAKATSARLTDKTLFTEHRHFIGTPEYMSPEQAQSSLDIDTRTDVYSLGVLLYELLVGTPPFDAKSLRSAAYSEIQRIIREVDPPRPSTRLSSADESVAALAARRQTEPARLNRLVRGELDWIVMKALEKDRLRRYETASSLALDVQRYMDHDPVQAAPPSRTYRLRKFVARNKAAVTAASLVAAALVLGMVGTTIGLGIANQQRRRAETNAATASQEAQRAENEARRARFAESQAERRAAELEQVADFQAAMLFQIDRVEAGAQLQSDIRRRYGQGLARVNVDEADQARRSAALEAELQYVNFTDAATTIIDRTVLTPAIAAIDARFADQPLVNASLRSTLARIYCVLGRYDEALALQKDALQTHLNLEGENAPRTINGYNTIAYVLLSQGKAAEAEPYIHKALEKGIEALPDDDPITLVAQNHLGALLHMQGKLAEAEEALRQALAGQRRTSPDHAAETIRIMVNLAVVINQRSGNAAAEPLLRHAVEASRRALRDDDPMTLSAMRSLSSALRSQFKLEEAEALQREILEKTRRLFGDEHDRTLNAMNSLSVTLIESGHYEEAEALCLQTLERSRAMWGEEHPSTIDAVEQMGHLRRAQGRGKEAEPWLRQALQSSRSFGGDEHPKTLSVLVTLGGLLRQLGNTAEAEVLLREAVDTSRRVLGPEHQYTLRAATSLGALLLSRRNFDEAEPLLRESAAAYVRVYGLDHPQTLGAQRELLDLVWRPGNEAEAELICRDLVERQRRVLGAENFRTIQSLLDMATLLRNQKKFAEAEPFALEAVEAYRRISGPEHPKTLVAMDHLAMALREQGKFAQAEVLYKQILHGRTHNFGEQHRQTLMSMRFLGEVLQAQGKSAEAEPLLRKLAQAYSTEFGAYNSSTGEARVAVGLVMKDLGRYAEAEAELLEAESILASQSVTSTSYRDCVKGLVDLYQAWHASDPGNGYAEQAQQWSQKLADAATTRPTGT